MGKAAETSPEAMGRTTPARARLGWFRWLGHAGTGCGRAAAVKSAGLSCALEAGGVFVEPALPPAGHRRAAHVLGWCRRPPGRDEGDEPPGDLGGVRVGLVDLDRCPAVGADRWRGRVGHGRVGPVTAGEVGDAGHGVLREHCGPLGPHEQHAEAPSRDGDSHMSRQQRTRLDRAAITNRINHNPQQFGLVGDRASWASPSQSKAGPC
jgi:hypothetical protein